MSSDIIYKIRQLISEDIKNKNTNNTIKLLSIKKTKKIILNDKCLNKVVSFLLYKYHSINIMGK